MHMRVILNGHFVTSEVIVKGQIADVNEMILYKEGKMSMTVLIFMGYSDRITSGLSAQRVSEEERPNKYLTVPIFL